MKFVFACACEFSISKVRANAGAVWVFAESNFRVALLDAMHACASFVDVLSIIEARDRRQRLVSRTRSVKWGQCFFVSYRCNPIAVHVDPRLHCSDIATSRG